MAEYKNTSITFLIVTIFLLVFSSAFRVLATADHDDDDGNNGSTGRDGHGQHILITTKYRFVWTKSALPVPRYDFSHFNDDIESVNCTSNIDCIVALPGVEAALQSDSDIPSAPYCNIETSDSTASNYCTCGFDRCVSYSREFDTGEPFYYCGPCGFVGSECKTVPCTHRLAECVGGYCECIDDGTYYDMSYCYIPMYGQVTMVNVLIGTTVVLLCCITMAYGYHRLANRSRRRGSMYSERGSGTTRRESPADDTPPTYDDVVEKLPSYQDALQMSTTDTDGVTNPAFERDDDVPPQYETHRDSTSSASVTCSQPKATSPAQDLNPTISPATHGGAEDDPEKLALNETEKCSNCKPPVTEEQQGLGTQPIELLLHNTLQTQNTINTTTL